MRLVELLRAGAVEITEEVPTGPLNAKQARERQDRKQKKLQRAAEITQAASTKAASIRADIT